MNKNKFEKWNKIIAAFAFFVALITYSLTVSQQHMLRKTIKSNIKAFVEKELITLEPWILIEEWKGNFPK